jgi:hypothetical protein
MSVTIGFAEVCEDIVAPVDQRGEAGQIVVTPYDGDDLSLFGRSQRNLDEGAID